MRFDDRQDAGLRLAALLRQRLPEVGPGDCLVLALPRGGVVVGATVARQLRLPLEVMVAHKLGAPGNPELAIGAVAEDGEPIVSQDALRLLDVAPEHLAQEVARQRDEIARRVALYRGGRPLPSLEDKVAILVDDGVATGHTVTAACRALRAKEPSRLVVAVPVAPPEAMHELKRCADRVVCLATPEPFFAVGFFYDDFRQVSDQEVLELLKELRVDRPPFEIFEHTADIGLIAYGRDLAEAFANAALGMASLMVELEGVGEEYEREVEVSADSVEELLVAWLSNLLYVFETEQMVGKRFEVRELTPGRLRARVLFGRVDPRRHTLKEAIKAVTYHLLSVEDRSTQGDGGFRLRVLFDV